MLVKKGFRDCRVVTPPDSAQKKQRPARQSSLPSPLASTVSTPQAELSLSPSSSPFPSPGPSTTHIQSLPLTKQSSSASTSTNTLKQKASLLSLTANAAANLVSTLWTTSAPLGAPGSVPLHVAAATAAAPSKGRAAAKAEAKAEAAEAKLDDERKATIRGWLAQTATSMAALSSPPMRSDGFPTAQAATASESAAASATTMTATASDMHRTSTESTLESAPLETPTDSPAGSAHLTLTTTKGTAQATVEPQSQSHMVALTASSLSRLRHALSDGALHTTAVATLPHARLQHGTGVGAAPASANAPSTGSKQYAHPSIASIFGSMLAGLPSPLPPATKPANSPAAGSGPTTALPSAGVVPAAEALVARPAPAVVQPGPQLLRKTASQHTLRKVARPVLDMAMAEASTSSCALPDTDIPVHTAAAPATAPGTARLPRHVPVVHRNPRDSPVGETRVLKASSGSSNPRMDSPLSRRASLQQNGIGNSGGKQQAGEETPVKRRIGAKSGTTSILDSADQEGGMWTPPGAAPSSSPSSNKASASGTRSSSTAAGTSMSGNGNSSGHPSTTAEKDKGQISTASAASVALPPSSVLRPHQKQLRAKESLEHILAVRKRQEAAELEREQRKEAAVAAAAASKRDVVQARQQSIAGRKALGELSSFHRAPLASHSLEEASSRAMDLGDGAEEYEGDEDEELEHCPVFKCAVPRIPSPPFQAVSAAKAAVSAAKTTAPSPLAPKRGSSIAQVPGTSSATTPGQSKLVRGPAVVGAPRRPTPAHTAAQQAKHLPAADAKPPPVPERSFTGTLKGLFGSAMDWIAEAGDHDDDKDEEGQNYASPSRSSRASPGYSYSPRRSTGIVAAGRGTRQAREPLSTMRGPPAPSAGSGQAMHKRESYSAFSAGTAPGLAATGASRKPAKRPGFSHHHQGYTAANNCGPQRRAHSLPVPTIVISGPTSD